jgi:hypothetical protein
MEYEMTAEPSSSAAAGEDERLSQVDRIADRQRSPWGRPAAGNIG